MVADHQRDVAVQLPGAVAVQQVGQAVVVTRGEDGHPLAAVGFLQPPVHRVLFRQGRKGGGELGQGHVEAGERPLHAHEKQPGGNVDMLIGVQNVGAVAVQELGHGGHQAALVGTGH